MNFKAFIDLIFRSKTIGGQGSGGGAGSGAGKYIGDLVKGFKDSFLGMFAAVEVANRAVTGMFAAVQKSFVITNISKRFGIATEEIRRLGEVAEDLGVGDFETIARMMARIQRDSNMAIGGLGGMAEAFGQLGISVEELQRMNPTQTLLAIAKGLEKASPEQRAAVMQKLFGLQAGQAQALLGHGSEFLKQRMAEQTVPNQATDEVLHGQKQSWKQSWDVISTIFTSLFAIILEGATMIKDMFMSIFDGLYAMFTGKGFMGILNAIGARGDKMLNSANRVVRIFAPDGSDFAKALDDDLKEREAQLKARGRSDFVDSKVAAKDIFGEATGEAEQAQMATAAVGVSSLAAVGGGGNVSTAYNWQKLTLDQTKISNDYLNSILRKMPPPPPPTPAGETAG
jgi:hypothetical protein